MTTQTFSERLAEKRSKSASPYIRRRDVRIYEERELHYTSPEAITNWKATVEGRLSTGEEVSASRSGASAAEALANLEAAIAEQGWEIR